MNMVSNSKILKQILRNGDYNLCFKIIPYVCIGLVLFNLLSVILDSYLAEYQLSSIRIGCSILFFASTFYFLKVPDESIKSKLIFEFLLAIGLPLSFSLFMFVNYSTWYFYCNIFLGGLLYGLVSGHFAVPVLNFPLMYYLGYLLSIQLGKASEPHVLEHSVGIFIVIWFSVFCTAAARIGFDVFYMLNLSLKEQQLRYSNIQKLHDEEKQKLILEKELDRLKNMESAGKFAGGIVHDFNNMLTVISSQMMHLKRSAADDSERGKIDIIMQSVKKTAQLISHLMQFTQNKVEEIQNYSLQERVLSVIGLINSTPLKPVIELDIISDECIITGNPNILSTTLINVILTVGNTIQNDTIKIGMRITREINPERNAHCNISDSFIDKYAVVSIGCKNSEIIEYLLDSENMVYIDMVGMIKYHKGKITKEIKSNYGEIVLHFPLVENAESIISNNLD